MMTKMAGIKIAQVNCGRDIIDVTMQDKQAHCYLNHIPVISSKETESFSPIVGLLIMSACRTPNVKISLKGKPSYNDFLKGIIDTVQKSDQAKIQVLDSKPDEITDNKPKEAKFDATKLDGFREAVNFYYNCFDNALSLSDVLLKTKLPKSAHSFKEIDRNLAKVKTAAEELNRNKENYEVAAEDTGNKVGQIITAINSERLEDVQVKRLIQAAVSHVVHDFLNMKKLLGSLITSHYPLYDMDRTFKKHTGYPATWFFDPSAYYNFTERYKDASDGLIDAVRSEASVVRPLYAWHIKVIGD